MRQSLKERNICQKKLGTKNVHYGLLIMVSCHFILISCNNQINDHNDKNNIDISISIIDTFEYFGDDVISAKVSIVNNKFDHYSVHLCDSLFIPVIIGYYQVDKGWNKRHQDAFCENKCISVPDTSFYFFMDKPKYECDSLLFNFNIALDSFYLRYTLIYIVAGKKLSLAWYEEEMR